MIFNMYKSRKWQEEKAYDYNSFIQQLLNKYYVPGTVVNTHGKRSSSKSGEEVRHLKA